MYYLWAIKQVLEIQKESNHTNHFLTTMELLEVGNEDLWKSPNIWTLTLI